MVSKWMPIAQGYQGVKEFKGSENPIIMEYFDAVGHGWVKEDEVPWCAAFVGACLEEAGVKSTGSLAARSYLRWGKKVDNPSYGDIVVFWRGKRDGWQGHVGFYVKEDKSYIYTLGGNQRNAVNVSRYRKSRLLGYRKAPSITNSRTTVGAAGTAAGVAVQQSLDIVRETQQTFLGFPVEAMQYVGLALAGFSLALILYARWDDLVKKGR